MIKEIVQFTQSLDEDFRNQGAKPKEGLHILLRIIEENEVYRLDTSLYEAPVCYNAKVKETDFLERCKFWTANAWCIDTNKCFDVQKAIHTCSPYCVAFKREHIKGGAKYIDIAQHNTDPTKEKEKKQIEERFGDYFAKALVLVDEVEKGRLEVFRAFFTQNLYIDLLQQVETVFSEKRQSLDNQISELKEQQAQTKDKEAKDRLKEQIEALSLKKETIRALDDSDYICFYLEEEVATYKKAHQKYLEIRLFNTSDYNVSKGSEIFGTSGFFNGFNANKPFLTHQTATFDISGRISGTEANLLYVFENVLSRTPRILPNPLPIFVFPEEREKSITLFKESGSKKGYKEIITELWTVVGKELGNYYLLNHDNTKDGIVFRDLDFVSKFEYELNWQIENLFDLKEKDGKESKHYPILTNVFDLEKQVFGVLLGDKKYYNIDYFKPLDSVKYEGLQRTFTVYIKYRKAVYDYIYKSQKQTIQAHNFNEMVFEGIKDDIKNNKSYTIKEKLNLWFSLYEKFNPQINMASNLKNYQQFVDEVALEKADLEKATDEQFAFAAGQVIDYVLGKSKSKDTSYQLLEPYLQHAKCSEFLKSLSNDIARYKHEINDKEVRFKRVSSFVLSYQTDTNLKSLLPQILAGAFAKSGLYGSVKPKTEQEN